MITIRPGNDTPSVMQFSRAPTLGEIQNAVGGDIEVVPGFKTIVYCGVVMDCVAFCIEHGKLSGLPINLRATVEWEIALHRIGTGLLKNDAVTDWLVGPVVVLFGDKEFMREL
jgi:hypothetical protein